MTSDELTITNRTEGVRVVVVEPWGQPFTLEPGQSLRIVASSLIKGELEHDPAPEADLIYAWPGATYRAYLDDELVEECDNVVPDVLPPGMTVRQFLGMMLGADDRAGDQDG